MKNQLLVGLLLALAGPAAAQHTELSGRAGLGLFRFGGRDAAKVSAISYYDGYSGGGPNGYTYNPYGRQLGTGFTLAGRMQRVGRRNGLVALEMGYDWLRSRTAVVEVNYLGAPYSSFIKTYSGEGTTCLRTQNLTAFLALGRRFKVAELTLDLLAGPEAASVFGLYEKGDGTYNSGTTWTIDRTRGASDRGDARLRTDVTAWYQKVGLTASYSHGLFSYLGNLDGGSSRNAYSRTLRLGLAYRLR